MKFTKISLLVTLLFFGVHASFGKPDQKQASKLEDRVQRLEDYKSDIDNVSKAQSENLKKYVDDEVKKEVGEIDEAKKTLDLLILVGVPGTILSLIVVFFGAVKYAKKIVLDKIVKIVEGNREEILRVIETEAFDTKLRTKKQLLVISGGLESENSLKQFMKKLKFKNVVYRIIDQFDEIPEHDLMIFNNQDGALSQEAINGLMQNTDDEDICYVAFTTVRLEQSPRLNFSNNRYTLYHSILSTLKFAEIAKLAD